MANVVISTIVALFICKAVHVAAYSCSNSPGVEISQGWNLGKFKSNLSTCCSTCAQASSCDAWSMDGKGNCELKTLWKDEKETVSNMRGFCQGRVNTALASSSERFQGDEFSCTSSAECCDECSRLPLCDGWELKGSRCELRHFSRDAAGKTAGFSPGADVPSAMKGKSCSVISNYKGKGKRIAWHRLFDLSEDDKDMECCAHCSANPDCEFWVRPTQHGTCYLHKDFRPVNFYDHGGWRTGFRPQNLAEPIYCKAVQFLWKMAGSILRRIKFNVGQDIEGAHIDLPTNLECGELTFQDNKLKGMLSNLTVEGHMTVKNVSKFALGSPTNVTLHIRSSPSFEVDFETCKTNNLKAGLWDIGLGIRSYGNYAGWLTHLISGGMYANLRQSSCQGDFVAFPAEMIHGKPIETFPSLPGSSQEELNTRCCQKCLENADCQGFVQRMLPKTPWCSLHKFSAPSEKFHGNFWWHNFTMESQSGTAMDGVQTDKVLVWGVTQEDRDAACQKMCLEADNCQMWMMSVENRECTLMTGIAKQGTVQAFRWIVNGIVDGLLNRLFGKSKYLCDKSWLQRIMQLLEYIENHSHDVTGQGSVTLDVSENFWDTADLSDEGFLKWQFPAKASEFDITAADSVLAPFVEDLAAQVRDSFGNFVVEQFGTGIPLSVGRFLRVCVENNEKCPSQAPPSSKIFTV